MQDWTSCGEITLCKEKGWPELPEDVPETPGLCRISFNKSRYIYIGEAGNIKKRLKEFRTGKTDNVLQNAIHSELVKAKGGKLDVITGKRVAEKGARKKLKELLIQKAESDGFEIFRAKSDKNSLVYARGKASAAKKEKVDSKQKFAIEMYHRLCEQKQKKVSNKEVIRALEAEGCNISQATCSRYLKGKK